MHSDSNSPIYNYKLPAYDISKTALNGYAVHLAYELSPADWFAKHTAVSDEDFAKEPHRNRLNVLLSRTIHQSNHLGQLSLLKKK